MAEKRNRDRNNDNQNRSNPVKSGNRQNIGRQDSSEMREDVEDQELRKGSRRSDTQNTGNRNTEIDESEE